MRMEYARLNLEIQGEEYRALFKELKEKASFFQRFETLADVIAFMRDGKANDQLTDEVLRPIFKAHKEGGDRRWRTILLVIFWPGLESIHWRKRGWDSDIEERWQNVVWTFLQVVCSIDLTLRPDRLVQKVINDTVHHLYDEYRRIFHVRRREMSSEDYGVRSLVRDSDGIDYARIALRYAQRAEIRRLKKHWKEGRINEGDYLMLVGTRVYKKSLPEYLRDKSLDYEAAKKRRLRVEAIIREYEKNLQKMSR